MSYGDLKTKIANEINRTDLTAEISASIQDAIQYYEDEHFHFNEARATASTETGTEFYALPSDYIEMDALNITISNRSYPLIKRGYKYIEDIYIQGSTYRGYPTDYAIYDEQLRLYPVPNDSFTLTISYTKELSAVSASSDSNAWLDIGEELIRCRAKNNLYSHVVRDDKEAQRMEIKEGQALMKLKRRSRKHTSGGKIRIRSI